MSGVVSAELMVDSSPFLPLELVDPKKLGEFLRLLGSRLDNGRLESWALLVPSSLCTIMI